MSKTILKSYYYLNDGYNKGTSVSTKSAYEHIATNSYRNYLQRIPKSLYKQEALSMLNTGNKLKDEKLVSKAKKKLTSLEKDIKFNEFNPNLEKNYDKDKLIDNYNPLHINLIISPEKWKNVEIPYPLAELHYNYLFFTKNLKGKYNNPTLFNYYGAFHNDNENPHLHLVIYQNKLSYAKKPLNDKLRVRQIYSASLLKKLKGEINNVKYKANLHFLKDNRVINKLIYDISLMNVTSLSNKDIFKTLILMKILGKNKFPEMKKIYNFLMKHKNLNQTISTKNKEMLNLIEEKLKVNPLEHTVGSLKVIYEKSKKNLRFMEVKKFIMSLKIKVEKEKKEQKLTKEEFIKRDYKFKL